MVGTEVQPTAQVRTSPVPAPLPPRARPDFQLAGLDRDVATSISLFARLVEPFKAWLQEHRYMSHEIPGLELALERALIAAGSQMLLPSLVTLAGNHSDVIQPDSFLDRWLNAFDESLKETSDPDRLGCIAPNALDEFLERAWNNGDFTDGNFVVAAVAEDCPIVELVGQGGLHAKGPRNKNTIVGLFGGKLEESREARTDNKLPTDLAAENQ